jgi:hypothetical protein
VEKGTSKIGDIPRLHPFAFGISSKLALDADCIAKHTSSCFLTQTAKREQVSAW